MTGLPDIIRWAHGRDMGQRPWLILGKGPTFAKLSQVDTSGYGLLALNHVVRERPVDIAHAIDLDVVHDCADAILANAGVLWMPAHPHVDCKPDPRPLWSWCDEVPVLRTLAEQGRLAWYNASTWRQPEPGSPLVQVRFFSAEAALHALALAGATTVRSLGVDGGTRYSSQFRDLDDRTRLANGHATFDLQFSGFANVLRSTGIFYAPLNVAAPARVFVGTDAAQNLGAKVLAYSIRRHASLSVSVETIDDTGIPVPRDPQNRSRTGFSFSRFRIPELCGHRGRGIYMDADMLVFSDIRRLWTHPLGDSSLAYAQGAPERGRPAQYSVMLLDCAALDWDAGRIVRGLDEGRYDYAGLMQRMCLVPENRQHAALAPEWNSMEHYEPGRTHLLHYTDMPTQPWVSHVNPHGGLFYQACRDALAEGVLCADEIYREIEAGHVAPDLAKWVGLAAVPGAARLRAQWMPPFRRFQSAMRATPKPG